MVFIISRMANDQSAPPFMKFVIPRTAPAGLFIFYLHPAGATNLSSLHICLIRVANCPVWSLVLKGCKMFLWIK